MLSLQVAAYIFMRMAWHCHLSLELWCPVLRAIFALFEHQLSSSLSFPCFQLSVASPQTPPKPAFVLFDFIDWATPNVTPSLCTAKHALESAQNAYEIDKETPKWHMVPFFEKTMCSQSPEYRCNSANRRLRNPRFGNPTCHKLPSPPKNISPRTCMI